MVQSPSRGKCHPRNLKWERVSSAYHFKGKMQNIYLSSVAKKRMKFSIKIVKNFLRVNL